MEVQRSASCVSFSELATRIGEVVLNKCSCTRRNPISISAVATYLAWQLEDRRKAHAEICKVTAPRVDLPELTSPDRDKKPDAKSNKPNQILEMCSQGKGNIESKGNPTALSEMASSWQPGLTSGYNAARTNGEDPSVSQGIGMWKSHPNSQEAELQTG
ncbi:hypothetical protein Ancab_003660 [Ancistrocladus abbreviatus]